METKRRKLVEEMAEWFYDKFPENLDIRKIGLEKEMPVVDADTLEAVDFRRSVFPALLKEGWTPRFDDIYSDELVAVENDGYLVVPDSDYGTVEVNFPPTDSLLQMNNNLRFMEGKLADIGDDNNVLFLGYGIQPKTAPGADLWVKRGRYEALIKALSSEIHNVTVPASDQTHIDITRDDLVDAVNVLNALTPVFIYLFANSPIWKGDMDPMGRLAPREEFWDLISTEVRGGIPPRQFESLEDLLDLSVDIKFLLSKMNGEYCVPGISFAQWVETRNADWQVEWPYHEGCIWWDARPRVAYGTVEFRPVCSQRQGESISSTAMVLGIVENLSDAKLIVGGRSWQEWIDLRKAAIYNQRTPELSRVSEEVINVALAGLKEQDRSFVSHLTGRCFGVDNPARSAIRHFRRGGLRELVEATALKSVK